MAAVECCYAKVVERIEGTPERVIIQMAGLYRRSDELRGWFMLEHSELTPCSRNTKL